MAEAFDPASLEVPEIIKGERILLRPYRLDDAKSLVEAISEARESLLPWMPWALNPNDEAHYRTRIREWRASFELRKDFCIGMFLPATAEDPSERFLGGTGLHRINWPNRAFSIGYWIRPSEVGKGYVTETVKLLTQFAFEALGARRVDIFCASENHRSAAVARRCGFPFEGTLRSYVPDSDGNLNDALMFAVTERDYEDWKKVHFGA